MSERYDRSKLPKVYVDTSVISCLDAPQTPERMIQTQLFWETAKRGEYEIVISSITLAEMDACPEPKRSFMWVKLSEIPFLTRIGLFDNAAQLASLYIDEGGLPPSSLNDALHIAIATIKQCDIVASWNLKHMVNMRAKKIIEKVNTENNLKRLEIGLPSVLILEEEAKN